MMYGPCPNCGCYCECHCTWAEQQGAFRIQRAGYRDFRQKIGDPVVVDYAYPIFKRQGTGG